MLTASEQTLQSRPTPLAKPISACAIVRLMRALDLAVIVLFGCVSYLATLPGRGVGLDLSFLGPVLIAALVALLVFDHAGLYERKHVLAGEMRVDRLLLALATTIAVFLLLAIALDSAATFSRNWAAGWIGSVVLGLVGCRIAVRGQILRLAAQGRFASRMVIVGTGAQGRRLAKHVGQHGWPFSQVVGFIDDRASRVPETIDGINVLGRTSDLVGLIQKGLVDEVVLAMPWSAEERIMRLIETFSATGVPVRVSPDLVGLNFHDRDVETIADLPALTVFDRAPSGWSQGIKRLEDLLLAGVALLFFSPLLVLIALLLKLESPGPILQRQRRQAFSDAPCDAWRFRTCRVAPANEDRSLGDCQPETRVGRILRETGLDEIPILLNVLQGELSLVGPRPFGVGLDPEARRLEELVAGRARRLGVKPGITGWAQVNGCRSEYQRLGELRRRVEHDLYYMDNWSLRFDLLILLRSLSPVRVDTTS